MIGIPLNLQIDMRVNWYFNNFEPYNTKTLPWWLIDKESTCKCRRCWIGKIPCRRKWQPIPVFLPRKSHGLISFRMDWLDLLAVRGTLKSLLQHHSSKASIPRHSTFFIVQLSYPYMTTGKTITLTRWTFVVKGMSLLFNMLSRLVIIFLPRNKHLLISWVQAPAAVILEPPKIKSATISTVSPSIYHEVMGLDAMILVFWMLSFKPTFSLSS